jgi:hypothetical protein
MASIKPSTCQTLNEYNGHEYTINLKEPHCLKINTRVSGANVRELDVRDWPLPTKSFRVTSTFLALMQPRWLWEVGHC